MSTAGLLLLFALSQEPPSADAEPVRARPRVVNDLRVREVWSTQVHARRAWIEAELLDRRLELWEGEFSAGFIRTGGWVIS
jgi:hypothetical protein